MAVAEMTAHSVPVARDPARTTQQLIEEHQARMKQRREERNKRLPELIACLDAEHAASVEAQKEVFRYSVKCTVQDYDQRLKRQVPIEKLGEVDAQNEDEAWAKFCDKFKVRTGPSHCNRQIKKLARRQAV